MFKRIFVWFLRFWHHERSSSQSEIDLVYIVKKGDDNEELRYSLRSVAKNFPHRNVVIAGYKPDWIQNVVYVPVEQNEEKYENSSKNFIAVCLSEEVSDDFILMNDDFFVMKYTKNLPVLRRRNNIDYYIGLFDARLPDGNFVATMRRAKEILVHLGFREISSYELHIPMMFNQKRYLAMVAGIHRFLPDAKTQHGRTLYGNFYNIGGARVGDVKIYDEKMPFSKNWRFLSSDDETFANGKVGKFIRESFRKKCRYEK